MDQRRNLTKAIILGHHYFKCQKVLLTKAFFRPPPPKVGDLGGGNRAFPPPPFFWVRGGEFPPFFSEIETDGWGGGTFNGIWACEVADAKLGCAHYAYFAGP